MKLTVLVDESVGKAFLSMVTLVKGHKKGAIGKAVEEAMRLWIKENREKLKEKKSQSQSSSKKSDHSSKT